MKHLLDVNLLIAGIVQSHSRHAQAHAWLAGRQIVLCPIAGSIGLEREAYGGGGSSIVISPHRTALPAPHSPCRCSCSIA